MKYLISQIWNNLDKAPSGYDGAIFGDVMITATEIFARGIKRHKVVVKSLKDAEVFIKELSSSDAHIFREVYNNDPSCANYALIVLSVVGSDGDPLFKLEDLEKLMEMSNEVIMELTDLCQQHCGLFTKHVDIAKN